MLKHLTEIKQLGYENPIVAIQKLDSIALIVQEEPAHIRNKYLLLKVEMQNKNGATFVSDDTIKSAVDYFDRKGNAQERQESHFYAGCVYSNLDDVSHALKHFLVALQVALENEDCDSIMLRDTYSHLHRLYYDIQDNGNALDMARKEYDLSVALNDLSEEGMIHLGSAYQRVHLLDSAYTYYTKALKSVQGNIDSDKSEVCYALLNSFSTLGKIDESIICYNMIGKKEIHQYSSTAKGALALAHYFQLVNRLDSAIFYFQRVIDINDDSILTYDAYRKLYKIYRQTNDVSRAHQHADMFITVSEHINLQEKQRMAGNVLNLFKFNRDENRERQIIEERETIKRHFIYSILLSIIILTLLLYYHSISRQKYLQRILAQEIEVGRLKENIKDKDNLITQKVKQNEYLIKTARQAQLEENHDSLIDNIRQAITGRHTVTEEEWNQLFHILDTQYPTFKERLLSKLKKMDREKQKALYLIVFGFTNPEIESLTCIHRSTIWRWRVQYSDLLTQASQHV